MRWKSGSVDQDDDDDDDVDGDRSPDHWDCSVAGSRAVGRDDSEM